MSEQLGSAELTLDADLGPLDRKLIEAERRTAAWLATTQTMLDRGMVPIAARMGATGTAFDQALTPPLARFGTATQTMAKQIDGSLAQIRLEQAATAREMERMATVAQASGAAQSAAAERTARAYAGEAGAAKASADAQVAAATRVAAAQRLVEGTTGPSGWHGGPLSGTARPGAERIVERAGGGGEPVWGVRGSKAAGSIGNPIVMVMEAANRTGLGSLAAAVGESSASGGARTMTVAEGGGGPSPTTIVASSGGSGGGGVPAMTIAPGSGGSGGRGTAALLGAAAAGGGDGGSGNNGILRKLLWGGGSGIPFLGAMAGMGSIGSLAGLGPEHLLMTAAGIGGSAAGAVAGGGLLAAGAAGQFAVGAGSDLAVMKSTLTDTKLLAEGYASVEKAVQKYGAGSKQAAMAQHEFNMTMAELGNTAGVKAEAGLAKQAAALNTFWDKATSNARVQAVGIFSQFLTLAHDYVPRVAQAAEQNLAIINRGIKPLFAWLEGPEGVGIWNDLERRFKQNLPSAVHAFSQALELVLKTIDAASAYTGGFTQMLDRFFTKWNSPQFFAKWHDEIGRLIGDFHLWATFLKVLGQDIAGFFSADVETGSSIIKTITGMLEKLREWERSVSGQERMHTIFQVHKEEIIALLKLLPPLLSAFSSIYMTLAPSLVKAFTGIAEAITTVIKGISELGPVARDVLGGALILWKLGLLPTAFAAVRTEVKGLTGDILGQRAANQWLAASQAQAAGAATLETAAETGAARAVAAEGLAASGAAAANVGLSAGELAASRGGVLLGGTSAAARYAPSQIFSAANPSADKAAVSLGSTLVRGAAIGGVAALGVNTALNVVGVHGPGNTIMTAAAAGAGLGFSFGGPFGAAAGGLIGGGIGFAISAFNKKAPYYGKKFAEGFVAPLAPMLTKKAAQSFRELLDKQANAVAEAKHPQTKKQSFEEAFDPLGLEPHHGKADPAKVFLAELRQGLGAAEALKSALAGATKHSVHQLVMNTAMELRLLGPEAQRAAAEAMVKYAYTLESEGKLPKHAVDKVIASLQHQFPGLVSYFREHAMAASAGVAAAMKMHQAEMNLASTLNNLRAQMELLNLDPVVNGRNWVHNTGLAMMDLRAIIATSTGAAKQDAINHLEELERKNHEVFGNMVASTKTNMAKWGQFVRGGLASAAPAAKQELGKFVARIEEAEEQGALSAQLGAKMIAEATNAELKALGGKEIPIPSLVQGKPKHGTVGAKGAAFGPGFAGGGLMQIGNHGEAGYDTVPLNVGGTPIAVAPGEQVAVFNRHQLPIVDAALAPMGGLAGLFQQVDTPHYMAQGGLVGKMVSEANKINSLHYPYVWGGGHGSFEGPYDCSGAVSAVLHAAGVLGRPEASGELASFGAPGPGDVTIYANPIHTFMSIMGRFFGTHGASGAGWYAGSALPGYAVRHVPGAGGLGTISTPKVSGAGAIAALARAGLGKAAAAANRYLAGHSFGAATMGGSEANMGHMVPGIMSIEQRAAGIAGLAWNPSIVAALLSHESGGGINEPPSGSLNATGPNQVIPSTFASYALAGHKQISNPLDNAIASMRYIKARYGSLAKMASTTGLLGGHYVGYARGGMLGFAGGHARGGLSREVSSRLTEPFPGGHGFGSPKQSSFQPGKGDVSNFYSLAHRVWAQLSGMAVLPANAHFPPLTVEEGLPGYGAYTQAGVIHEPWENLWAILHGAKSTPRFHNNKSLGLVHEFAHTMQNAKTRFSVPLKEGGAQAWADAMAPRVYGGGYRNEGDGNYAGYTEMVRRTMGPNWIFHKQFARGGLIPGFSGGGGVAHHAAPKVGKPRGVRHVKRPAKPRAMSLSHLTTALGKIPGMTGIGNALGPSEATYNLLGDEGTLLGGMTSNPASILAADMAYLNPTLMAGENIGPGMLVPHAERELQRAQQAHGESPGLTLQGSLLQWIGGLDDHRLLSAPDIGVLAKDFKGKSGHTPIHGVPLPIGYPVFRAQEEVLKAQLRAQNTAVGVERLQKNHAEHFIKVREKRKRTIERLLKVVYARYRNIQHRLMLLKTQGLNRRLSEAQKHRNALVVHQGEVRDAGAHRLALREAIASEKALNPWEQNQALLTAWQAEERHLGAIVSSAPPSTSAISHAREALQRNTLQNELTPLGEQLHVLGGSSTSIGHGGEWGVETKQIAGLQTGAHELDAKIKEAVQSTIPQLELSIAAIHESLAEQAESVAPATIPGTAEKPGETELASLLKQQLGQTQLALAVSQAQYKVFAGLGNLPPFAGKFHDGGIVPGPLGQEMMALVRSGEVISQPGNGMDTHVKVHVEDGAVDPNKIRVVVREETRSMSRSAGRPLPSRGGGMLG